MNNLWIERIKHLSETSTKSQIAKLLGVSRQRLYYWLKVGRVPYLSTSARAKLRYHTLKGFTTKKGDVSFTLFLKNLTEREIKKFIKELKLKLKLFFRKTFFQSWTEIFFCASGQVRRIAFSNMSVTDDLDLYKDDIIDRIGIFALVDKCPEVDNSSVARWDHIIFIKVR